MLKHPSAQKRHRQGIKRAARNHAIKSQVRRAVRQVREAVAAQDASQANTKLLSATRAINKAATKGVLHQNSAARKVSRLTRAVRSLAASG